MGKFAKIIELEDGNQVLLVKGYNEDDEAHEVVISTYMGGCLAQIKLGFDSEGKADEVIDTYTMEQAIGFRSEIGKMFD